MTLYNYDRRRFVAMKHPSEDALKKYLQEHPKANPKNHTVSEGSKEGPGGSKDDDEAKTKKVVDSAMRNTGTSIVRGMGLSQGDARKVLKNWFDGKEPTNPKHQKAWQYLNSPGSGREQLSKLVDSVRQALKKSGKDSVGFKDVAKAVDAWLKDPPKPTYK